VAEILLDEQSAPAAPAAGQIIAWPDSGSSAWAQRNDAGRYQGDDARAAIAAQLLGVGDTYVTNSGLILPSFSMQAGMVFEWILLAVKTAAGVAAPSYNVRIGAAQSTADTARLTIAGPAQTAVVDAGQIRILVTVRSVAVAGVIQGQVHLTHNLAATGFATTGPAGESFTDGTSAGFNNTALGGQFVGLSINAGAASAWTLSQVFGRVYYG